MRITHLNRTRERLLNKISQEVEDILLYEMQRLWRGVRAKIGRINTINKVNLWETFRIRLHSRLLKVYGMGLIELMALNKIVYPEWEDMDTKEMSEQYMPSIGLLITKLSDEIRESIQTKVSVRVQQWHVTSGDTMQNVVDDLLPIFGADRAKLIAQTEMTRLNSGVQEMWGNRLGIQTWWWQTKRDHLVCKKPIKGPDGLTYRGCRELHGKIFKMGQNMPPDGSHPGCRCDPMLMTSSISTKKVIESVYLLKMQFEESKHPRANDGRFGNKSGESKGKTVGDVVREKASPIAVGNVKVHSIAKKHFHAAMDKIVQMVKDKGYGDMDGINRATKYHKETEDPREGFNNFLAEIKTVNAISNAELNRVALNIRNRYYQKLRGAKLSENIVPVKLDPAKIVSGEQMRTHLDKLVAEYRESTKEQFIAKTSLEDEYGKITTERNNLYQDIKKRAKELGFKVGLFGDYNVEGPVVGDTLEIREWKKQYTELTAKREEIDPKLDVLKKELDIAEEAHLKNMRSVFALPDGEHIKLTVEHEGVQRNKARRMEFDEQVNWMESAYSNKMISSHKVHTYRTKTRSHAQGNYSIHIEDNIDAGVVCHEIAHTIENRHDSIRVEVTKYRNERTKGNDLRSLRKDFPNRNFDKDEFYRDGGFPDAYCGKEYNSGHTEMLSMGIGYMYQNAEKFAKADPGYFDLIFDIMRGNK